MLGNECVCVCGYLVCIHASQRGRVRAQCVYTRALHLISLRRVRTQTAEVLAEPKYICSRDVYLYDECDTVALLRARRASASAEVPPSWTFFLFPGRAQSTQLTSLTDEFARMAAFTRSVVAQGSHL